MEALSEALKQAKSQLHNELTCDPPLNRNRIRFLCREHPGLIAASSLRLKLWIILLLGKEYDVYGTSGNSNLPSELQEDLVFDDSPCLENHVLENDVTRTRAEIEVFRSTMYRESITIVLQEFCKKYSIQYKQGMNEVLAPFLYLTLPCTKSRKLPFILFESFIFRYLERYFCIDDSGYLYKAFRLFHLLLLYYDPQLALHLQENDFPPELYSPQWFLTLYSRSLPMAQVLRLWDMLISIDDPAFTFFVGLCLLRRLRVSLLLAQSDTLPELLRHLIFNGEEDIDNVMIEAMQLYKSTPRCFCRNLRLCCVSTAELSPQPMDISQKIELKSSQTSIQIDLDRTMSIQSVKKCIEMSAQELISILLPISTDSSDETQNFLQQFVLIDIRSQSDSETTGGGIIPKALCMDPEFLNQPDALDAWIQHFDGTRGCNICIIDLPPGKASSISLWRRLILGDGDGTNSIVSYGSKWMNANNGSNLVSNNTNNEITTIRDLDSKFYKEEEIAIEEDNIRSGVKLAEILQKNSFPNICILDGGFPALVQQLTKLRGTTEPLIINHQSDIWEKFLSATGREKYSVSSRKKYSSNISLSNTDMSPSKIPEKTVSDMSELEVAEVGYNTAIRLGHSHIAKILEERIKMLSEYISGTNTPNTMTV